MNNNALIGPKIYFLWSLSVWVSFQNLTCGVVTKEYHGNLMCWGRLYIPLFGVVWVHGPYQ